MERNSPQEWASTYFNPIINRTAQPITVDKLAPETVARFEDIIKDAFPAEAELMKRRLRYLIPYLLNSIDWDAYNKPLEGWQLAYYYRRDRFLEATGLSYEDFIDHKLLMNAVEQLGLAPEPTFEFILFLKYYYGLRSELRFSPLEMLSQLQKALETASDDISMDVKVKGKHYKFANAAFIKQLFISIDGNSIDTMGFRDDFSEGGNRDKIRALDYYMIKTLLDYLPANVEKRKGKFTQAERNFSLCVLNFVGRLSGDDIEGICSHENNVTFDKLMRDFKSTKIPFAMELFL